MAYKTMCKIWVAQLYTRRRPSLSKSCLKTRYSPHISSSNPKSMGSMRHYLNVKLATVDLSTDKLSPPRESSLTEVLVCPNSLFSASVTPVIHSTLIDGSRNNGRRLGRPNVHVQSQQIANDGTNGARQSGLYSSSFAGRHSRKRVFDEEKCIVGSEYEKSG